VFTSCYRPEYPDVSRSVLSSNLQQGIPSLPQTPAQPARIIGLKALERPLSVSHLKQRWDMTVVVSRLRQSCAVENYCAAYDKSTAGHWASASVSNSANLSNSNCRRQLSPTPCMAR